MTRARDLARLGNTNAISVDTNLNIGIGITNPQGTLQVGTGVTIYGNSGIVSATSFYGDESAVFSGIVTASGGFNLGISSAGTNITSGPITTLNFVGTGNTFAVNGTTVDISIQGGSGTGGGAELDITASLFL